MSFAITAGLMSHRVNLSLDSSKKQNLVCTLADCVVGVTSNVFALFFCLKDVDFCRSPRPT